LKIGAYVLLADPTWIAKSISAYYHHVDYLVVSYDSDSCGWTGHQIPVAECLEVIDRLDIDQKVIKLSDSYSRYSGSPMQRETNQRQTCINYLSDKVEWILQLDTDEWLPNVTHLLDCARSQSDSIQGIEWPMRVLYRQLSFNRYLAVCGKGNRPTFEYPAPVLVRCNAPLVDARRINGRIARYAVTDDHASLQLQPSHTQDIQIIRELTPDDVIVHNSWARSPRVVLTKIKSWGHNDGWKSIGYFVFVWLLAPVCWPLMNDFHPFSSGLWSRLHMFTLPDEM
jgi:hypothetical protein